METHVSGDLLLWTLLATVLFISGCCLYGVIEFFRLPDAKVSLIVGILRSLNLPQSEAEYIAGDLLEEFNEITSRSKAYLWLIKQILQSALPLAHEVIKSSVGLWLGKRTH